MVSWSSPCKMPLAAECLLEKEETAGENGKNSSPLLVLVEFVWGELLGPSRWQNRSSPMQQLLTDLSFLFLNFHLLESEEIDFGLNM